jgi:glycosyltransferase involved in cell wall biosynthesis
MATFDIAILTSLWEGLPQVLVQAAAIGKPIVTFDVEGAKEVVKDGVNGFIVPLKDVDALVDKMGYLLADTKRPKSMGERGKAMISDKWSIRTMQEQTRCLYDELVVKAHRSEKRM